MAKNAIPTPINTTTMMMPMIRQLLLSSAGSMVATAVGAGAGTLGAVAAGAGALVAVAAGAGALAAVGAVLMSLWRPQYQGLL